MVLSYSQFCIKRCEKFPILGVVPCSQNGERKPFILYSSKEDSYVTVTSIQHDHSLEIMWQRVFLNLKINDQEKRGFES